MRLLYRAERIIKNRRQTDKLEQVATKVMAKSTALVDSFERRQALNMYVKT